MTRERILVVDDMPSMLRTVRRILEPKYEVATAHSLEDALVAANEIEPDLAILDVHMRKTSGFEILERLREDGIDCDIIFMTGAIAEIDAHIIRSIREQAFYLIRKPFDRELLLTIVQRCLELRRLSADNARHVSRLERNLAAARSFQQSMLPGEFFRAGDVSVAARYRPYERLGGDFYDFASSRRSGITVLAADVSGHGVAAAMLTAVVKSAFHDAHVDDYNPYSVVRRISSGIRAFEPDHYVTLFCARIDAERNSFEYVNAGHPPGLLRRTGGGCSKLPATGLIVSSAFPDAAWELVRLETGRSGRLLVYTDGITEARNGGEDFGEGRLVELFESREGSDSVFLDRILAAVDEFTAGRPAEDDKTLLSASWK